MGSDFDSFDQSAKDAFIESPLGARGAESGVVGALRMGFDVYEIRDSSDECAAEEGQVQIFIRFEGDIRSEFSLSPASKILWYSSDGLEETREITQLSFPGFTLVAFFTGSVPLWDDRYLKTCTKIRVTDNAGVFIRGAQGGTPDALNRTTEDVCIEDDTDGFFEGKSVFADPIEVTS